MVLRKTLLSHTAGLLRGYTVPLVVAQEDVLEARLVAGERHDWKAGGRLDHRVRGSLHRQAHRMAVVQRLHVGYTLQRLERLGRNRAGERDRDLVALDGLDLGHVTDAHETPVADDADPVAGLLDLAQDMGRKEYRASFIARLFDHVIELLLVQRIEAAGRLVENQQARAVHEGLDQDDLALVSSRVLAELSTGVEIEALDQLLEVGLVDAPAQIREVLEDLAAGQAGIERGLARQVADEALDLQRLLPAVEPCDPRDAGVGMQQRHQYPDGRCLARAVRAQEAEHLALLDRERDVGDAALAAVALGQSFHFDDRCHVSPLYYPNQKRRVGSSVSVSDPFGIPRIRSKASVLAATARCTISKLTVPAWRAMKRSVACS